MAARDNEPLSRSRRYSYCRFCGPRLPSTQYEKRFCENEVSGPRVRCGIALERRFPLLIDSGSADSFILRFDGYPSRGQVFIGRLDETGTENTDSDGDNSGIFINLAKYDRDELVLRKHAIIRVEDGSFYIRRDDPEADILVNERPVEEEQKLNPFDRIKIGQCLLFFLP